MPILIRNDRISRSAMPGRRSQRQRRDRARGCDLRRAGSTYRRLPWPRMATRRRSGHADRALPDRRQLGQLDRRGLPILSPEPSFRDRDAQSRPLRRRAPAFRSTTTSANMGTGLAIIGECRTSTASVLFATLCSTPTTGSRFAMPDWPCPWAIKVASPSSATGPTTPPLRRTFDGRVPGEDRGPWPHR